MDRASGAFEQHVTALDTVRIITAMDELFNHYDANLEMWNGEGDRKIHVEFKFDEPFESPPAIVTGVVGIDSDEGRNLRFGMSVEKITELGFEIVFVTWADTRIARASISWQATGPEVVRTRPPRPKTQNASEVKK